MIPEETLERRTDEMPGAAEPRHVSFRDALRFWLKLGFISFGGPAGQIAVMHQELVERRRWISEHRFLHALNYCMALPGPEAQQLATYIGWLMHRTRGGIAAGALFVLPSLVVLIALSWMYMAFGQVAWVAGLFHGVKPAVAAIVVQAVWRIGTRTLTHPVRWAIAAAAFCALFFLHVPFPAVIAAAALAGYVGGRAVPQWFQSGERRASHFAASGRALIDDDTPTPDHAKFHLGRCVAVVAIGLLLWALPMALFAMLGRNGTLVQMGWFFTKAALLTFGGAYAVLPYVYQGSIVDHRWLTPPQMIDGLALGETTPGPLIMVVAFIGFVGGWGSADLRALFGLGNPQLAGIAAACAVTWFTFLPSFIFIFAAGPLVEATHRDLHLTAPLTAITAAVVGVMLNLAVFFGHQVLWPQGSGGTFDAESAFIAAAALLALLRLKRGVMEVIAACAAIGVLLHLHS